VKVKIRLFATLRDRAGTDHVELDLPESARSISSERSPAT